MNLRNPLAKVLLSALLISAAPAATAANKSSAARPNILFIMADDHAAHAISAYGSKINRTPNIDRIAKGGMRFNHCFAVNSICAPSRASIMTGKYSHINGVTVFNRFDEHQWTVAKELQKAGYHTAMVGKWHLTSDPTGFDYWNILPGQGKYYDPEFIKMGQRTNISGYVSDIIGDVTLEFLKNRPTDRPFFLMCHHKAPHRRWDPGPNQAQLYEDVDIPEPATLNDNYETRTSAAREATMTIDRHLNRGDLKVQPPSDLADEAAAKWRLGIDLEMEVLVKGQKRKLTGEELKKWKYQKYIKDYLRCVAGVDENVGRVLDFLDESGLSENTIVIYTSDQGFFLGDHNWYDKRFMYEESIKMPFLIRHPDAIKAGKVSDAMILNVDFAPTFLDFAGAPAPKDLQGRSIKPLLAGKTPKDWRKSWYYRYYHYPGDHRAQPHYGVRTDRYKLIHFNRVNEWELFDLRKDPRELNNVYGASKYAGTVSNLKAEMTRLRQELDDHDQLQDVQR